MKTVLVSLAAVAALASAAFASPEPRCWYGQNSKSCVAFQSTNGTRTGDEKFSKDRGGDVRETDHNRATTRPY